MTTLIIISIGIVGLYFFLTSKTKAAIIINNTISNFFKVIDKISSEMYEDLANAIKAGNKSIKDWWARSSKRVKFITLSIIGLCLILGPFFLLVALSGQPESTPKDYSDFEVIFYLVLLFLGLLAFIFSIIFGVFFCLRAIVIKNQKPEGKKDGF